MAKTKTKESKKAQASEPIAAKAAAVTKSSKKEVAKSASKKLAKEEPKKKKVVEPESSDDSEEEEDSDSESDSDSDSDSEEKKTTKKAAVNGKAKAAAAADSSDSDSDSDSESEKETVKKPVANGKAKAAASDSDSDSDSDSEEEVKTKTNGAAKAAAADSSDSSDSSDSDDEKPAAKKAESDDSEDDSDDSASEAEKAAPASKKRKADSEIDAEPKKAKTDENAASTLFAGSLSWGIDDNSLYEAFKEFEGLVSARVVTDKLSGRSRGFGYVDFNDAESATKAYEAMQGKELEGRAINLDYANSKPTDANPQARAADRAQKHGDSVSPESDTLFVGNLPFDVDQDSVHQFFSEVREPTSVRLPTDPDSGNLKGFGYVSFTSIEDAKHVFNELNGASIGSGRMSRNIRLDYASARPPREGGGGFGGGFGGGRGRGGRGGGRGGDRGGRGGRGRGFGGDRGRGGGRGGFSRGGGSSFSGSKISFD